MEQITQDQIKPGDILLMDGVGLLPDGIQFFQEMRFQDFEYNYLTHVGIFDRNRYGDLMVFEQDHPGRFQRSDFTEEYVKEKKSVYVLVPKIPFSEKGTRNMLRTADIMAGKDVILNYSYRSYFGFMGNAAIHRTTGKDVWPVRPPKKKTTCSQIVAKLMQDHLGQFTYKPFYMYFPCEFAMNEHFTLKKLVIIKEEIA